MTDLAVFDDTEVRERADAADVASKARQLAELAYDAARRELDKARLQAFIGCAFYYNGRQQADIPTNERLTLVGIAEDAQCVEVTDSSGKQWRVDPCDVEPLLTWPSRPF